MSALLRTEQGVAALLSAQKRLINPFYAFTVAAVDQPGPNRALSQPEIAIRKSCQAMWTFLARNSVIP